MADELQPWPFPCRACRGTGEQKMLVCSVCKLIARLAGVRTIPAYRAARVLAWAAQGERFHCQHDILSPDKLTRPCPNCDGKGAITRLVPAEKAARLRRRADKKRKQQQARAADIILRMAGSHRQTWDALCGARTRAGGHCQRRCLRGRTRCVQHGGVGLSEAGRQAIIDSNKRRGLKHGN